MQSTTPSASKRSAHTNWTTPAQLRQKAKRLWDRGAMLASLVTGEPLFPKRLPIRGPKSADLAERFDEVRNWATALRAMPRVRIEERAFRHRLLGTNSLPCAAWLDGMEDAVALLGKASDQARFERTLELTHRHQPVLLEWLGKKPLAAVEQSCDWERLLAVVAWMKEHPRPRIYVRQMDVPGVDTKFIERHRGLLSELLDCALPEAAIEEHQTGVRRFESRYGFRTKPERIRFRMLDASCANFGFRPKADIETDAATFAKLEPMVSQAFIVENEINFLAFPDVPDSMAIFGAGYGFHDLGEAHWLDNCRLRYWGDIDTHGFAILDELRTHFPHAESFLMDRATLLGCKQLWGREQAPATRDLPRLSAAEKSLYEDLCANRLGESVRLEQERIDFAQVRKAIGGESGKPHP